MSVPLVLLVLRVVAALLLLAFLGIMFWLVYTDMRLTAALVESEKRPSGQLQVMASDIDELPIGTILPLLPVTRIGRAASSTIAIDDGYVSTRHALITRQEQQWWLEDLGSRNGTLLNDLRLGEGETAVLAPGDVVGVGTIRLRLLTG